MRTSVVVVAVALLLTPAAARGDDRWAPIAVRDATLGCWQLRPDQQLLISPFGKHSIQTKLLGADHAPIAPAPWSRATAAFEVRCRSRAYPDITCLAAPEGAQLHVLVFRNLREPPVEDLHLARCSRGCEI
jgi:hypothetical protein